jgi:hypothetical protein
MRINFSELLDSQRVRPLWGRSVDSSNAVETLNQILDRLPAPGAPPTAQSTAAPSPASGQAGSTEHPPLLDLADVPIEPPHRILNALEAALQAELGTRSAMVRNLIEPLRVRIHRLDPTAAEPPYHPLRHAAGGSIAQLLNRLEDTLHGLRRVAGK